MAKRKLNKAGDRRGMGTRVKNLQEVRDLSNEIDDIILNFDLGSITKEMNALVSGVSDFSSALDKSAEYSKENQDIAKGNAKAAQAGLKYATSRNFLAKAYYGTQLKMTKGGDEFAQGLRDSINHSKQPAH